MTLSLTIAPAVHEALERRTPVVALESTVIAHGLPAPRNREVARACEQAVRDQGATPATIAVLDGKIVIGCDETQIDRLATSRDVTKVSRRDLAAAIARRRDGATTVAGTMACAAAAGIRLMTTGGIGGVHRDGENTFEVSADLDELGRTPVAVMYSGAKSILDLPRTLEVLETKGVPVAGYKTDTFPAFLSRDSGLAVPHRFETPLEAAQVIATHLAPPGARGLIIANPVPADAALEAALVDRWVQVGLARAAGEGITGKDITPYLLGQLVALSDGATLETNASLLVDNAALAARIAVALEGL